MPDKFDAMTDEQVAAAMLEMLGYELSNATSRTRLWRRGVDDGWYERGVLGDNKHAFAAEVKDDMEKNGWSFGERRIAPRGGIVWFWRWPYERDAAKGYYDNMAAHPRAVCEAALRAKETEKDAGYNFKAQFADDVESGVKAQTIRSRRKRPTKAGDMLYMFTGMRTKQCRKLGQWRCTSVEPIRIRAPVGKCFSGAVTLNDWKLTPNEIVSLALADGFGSTEEFYDFFSGQYGVPTKDLEIIKWDPRGAGDAKGSVVG